MEQARYWLLEAVAKTNIPEDAEDPRRWERWGRGCELVMAHPLQRERLGRLLAGEELGLGPEAEEPLEFTVPRRALQLDYVPLPLEEGGGLASPRLQGLLADYRVGHRVYAVRLREGRRGRVLSREYALVVWPRERAEEVIDWERTEYRESEMLSGRCVRTLGIKEGWAAQGRLLVGVMRVMSSRVARVLVHERLRRAMEEAGLRGLGWAPLSACVDPCSGVRVEGLRAYLGRYPEDGEGWYALAGEYMLLHQEEAGLEAIERAVQLRPDDARVWYRRGWLLWDLGRREEALESYRRAWERRLEEGPGGWWYAWIYGRMLRKMGRVQEAVRVLEEELRERPELDDDRMWYELGRGYQEQGAEQEALEAFGRALARPVEWRLLRWEPYLRRGQVLAKQGRLEEALEAYEEGMRWGARGVEFWRGKEEVLRALGREEEAGEAERELRQLEEAEDERKKWPPYPF